MHPEDYDFVISEDPRKPRPPIQLRKERFVNLFKKYNGNVSQCCDEIGMSRKTFKSWMFSDPDFREAIEDLRERLIDFAESKLLQNVNKNEQRAIEYYLNAKGKERGYGVNLTEYLQNTRMISQNVNVIQQSNILNTDEIGEIVASVKKHYDK